MSDFELRIDDGFIHRVTPATEAPRVETTAPNSIFSMGERMAPKIDTPPPKAAAPAGAPVPAAAAPKTRRKHDPSKITAAILTQGSITMSGVKRLYGCVDSVACNMLRKLRDEGAIHVARTDGLGKHYELGAAPAQAVPKPADAPAAQSGSDGWFVDLPRGKSPLAAPDDLRCALFNTGELIIEVGGGKVFLTDGHRSQLESYLNRMQRG